MAAALSETAPLLSQVSGSSVKAQIYNDHLQHCNTTDEIEPETTWKIEAKLLAYSSAPLVATYVLQYSYPFVTVLVAGWLGTSELAAASLASMTAEITGLAIYEGLATSLDTLTSQAFGAGRKELVGLHVQRMIALTLLVTLPIGAVWICSPWILAFLVPQRKVAYLAGDFLRFYLIGAPGYGVFEALKRFTQAQGDFTGPMVTALICAPLNIFWNWLLVFVSCVRVQTVQELTRVEIGTRLPWCRDCGIHIEHYTTASLLAVYSIVCSGCITMLARSTFQTRIRELDSDD